MTSYILNQRLNIIREIFGDVFFEQKTGEVVCFCKEHYHHKKKLQINIKTGRYHCWVCGFGGKKIFYLLRKYATPKQRKLYLQTMFDVREEEKTSSIKLPDEYRFLLEETGSPNGSAAYSYLRSIGIDDRKILLAKVGVCNSGMYRDRIIFPSFNLHGNLNFFTTRSLYGQGFKYVDCETRKSDIVFNELYVNYNKPIILTEGIKTYLKWFDTLNIVPLLGSSLNKSYLLFSQLVSGDVGSVVIALDPDAKTKAMKIAKSLSAFDIDVRIADFEKQPDELLDGEFLESIVCSETFSKDLMIRRRLTNL